MKIASWNVNSLRVRLPAVLSWLEASAADVLALQETKLQDADFPLSEIEAAGYRSVFSGQKTYNGVAILSRSAAEDTVTTAAGADPEQKRILAATIDGVRVINLYVVNGREVGSEYYEFKLDWLAAVTDFVRGELDRHEKLVVLGDFNIAPEDADVHDPELWHERILCSTPEREALQRLMQAGLKDTFRLFRQPPETFSWWDYRGGSLRRNHGLRIDLILASEALAKRCTGASIDKAPRKLERPSDHTPVVAEFAD